MYCPSRESMTSSTSFLTSLYPNVGPSLTYRVYCLSFFPSLFLSSLTLTVKPLSVEITSKKETISAGRKIEVSCRSIGSRPPAIITWYKNNKLLSHSRWVHSCCCCLRERDIIACSAWLPRRSVCIQVIIILLSLHVSQDDRHLEILLNNRKTW